MTTPPQTTIRPRERDALLQSLRSGVVPRMGQQHVQVGRVNEVKALLCDINRINDAVARQLVGDYGSGKNSSPSMRASPDRRLHATGGQARSLYTELMRNMASRAKPDGGAMPSIVGRFVSQALTESRDTGAPVESIIRRNLSELSELTGGYGFAEVIAKYWQGHDTDNEQLKSDAVRWLRGEFSTRTDARSALGVRKPSRPSIT
ncbi:BREX system ATP-binding domain-containing protein [Arthrobacter sp. KNU40]|uniref:BREX system ATP-binding domain-containing protein n=1 Tax=Arthrobacter sp. KNU40 TaxID=3447965 RepID=UPI003F6304FA